MNVGVPAATGLRALLADQLQAADEAAASAGALDEVCTYLLSSSGKGLRSAVLLEAARNGPLAHLEVIRRAALAVEIVHLASLAHDDVVDDADLRRGTDAASLKFGNQACGLGGVWMFTYAVEIVSECGDQAMRQFVSTVGRMCEGEMLEIQDLYNVERSTKRYFDAVEGKTGALFSLAARLGAELSGADDEAVVRLGHYGFELGIAFQIADDLQDLRGTVEVLGKTPGSDLRHGIYTLPVIYAAEENPEIRTMLRQDVGEEELGEIVEKIRSTDAMARTLEEHSCHTEAAETAVKGLPNAENLTRLADEACSMLRAA